MHLPSRRGGERAFVVQKHDASHLHYDFRLEIGGVMKSWSVPKGPSLDPSVKRLAVEVEDHAMGHADFEGRAGRGGVIIWDRGSWRALDASRSPAAWLDAGHLSFWLDGEKLRGGYTLHRTRGGAKAQWLLIKRRDEGADARRNPVSTQPESVISGRTIEEVGSKK